MILNYKIKYLVTYFYLLILFCFSTTKIIFPEILPSSYNIAYSIDDIEFKFLQTKTFDKNILLDIMTLSKKKTFSHLDLEKDQLILKKFYFDNGFFNAVIDTSTVYDNQDMSVKITMIILEKNRYKINFLTLSGLDSIKPDIKNKIYSDVLLKPGIYYERSLILSETNRVLDLLQNNGYAFARIDTMDGTTVYKSPNQEFVNLELTFLDAKKQYRFGNTKVNIANNKYGLSDDLILRELSYKKGELYNKDNVLQSERNFSNFSIIQSGKVQIDSIIESKAILNFIINITLTNKYDLTPSVSGTDIDNQFYAGAGLEYADKNFLGGGRVLSIGLDGYLHSTVVNIAELKASVFQPFFLNNSTTATFNTRFGIYNLSDKLNYLLLRNLFQVSYTLPVFTFYNSILTDLTGDLVRQKIKTIDSLNPSITHTSLSNLMNSILGITIIHDNTNDIFFPWAGFYHTITLENGGLLPKFINLFSHNLDYSQYVKLYTYNKFYSDLYGTKNSIAAAYFRIGDIIEYGSSSNIVPIASIYKFFSGGSSSVRGWDARKNGYVSDPGLGGNFIFEGSFEYRWHTFPNNVNFMKNLWTVYFIDYGSIWDKAKYFRFNEISLAIGFGVRYTTFVGPLRIDFGFKLYDPKALPDRRWLFNKKAQFYGDKLALQFGLGNAF